MQQENPTRSWYHLGWKKWLAIYVVAGGIIYAIVYFAFLRDSGYGGGGSGGGGGGYAFVSLPLFAVNLVAEKVRRLSAWRSGR